MEDEELELLLGARFQGLEQARQYAETMERIARAETNVARASQSNSGGGGNARAAMTYAPPASSPRLATAGNAPASAGGGRGFSLPMPKLGGRAGATMEGLESAIGPAIMRGIGGGVGGVVGTLARAAGPVGAVISTIVSVGKAMYDLAQSSAAATNALSSIRTMGGARGAEQVQTYSGAIGTSAQNARGFQERISGSDEGRSAAARIGMSNTRAPYGSMRFNEQYMEGIKRTAAITDENQRQRLAYMLGIEEEVARYSKLSGSTRRSLDRTALATKGINSPEAARDAAELQAQSQRASQAAENFKTSVGQNFMQPALLLQEATAEFFDELTAVARVIQKLNEYSPLNVLSKLGRQGLQFAQDHQVGPLAQMRDRAGGADTAQSATAANTAATAALTSAIDRLTGNLGGGANAREYLTNAQKAPFMHEALTRKAIRSGAMG